MKKLGSIFVLAGIAFVVPALAEDRVKQSTAQAGAPRAVTDPLKNIYVVSGIRDNGQGPGLGVATSFHCTNWSNEPQELAIVVLDYDSTLVGSASYTIGSRYTFTISTHATLLFDEDAFLTPGVDINQGFAHLAATTTKIHCSAMIVDAANPTPNGISLHLVRFNPFSGTQE